MVTIHVKNIEGKTILPVAGSAVAAGYDLIALEDPKIVGEIANVKKVDGKDVTFYRRVDYLEYHTGLFISPQSIQKGNGIYGPGAIVTEDIYHTLIHPRSSVRKYDLVLANSIGLIDADYRGELIVCYKYIWQPDTLAMETVEVPVEEGSIDTKWEMTGRMLGAINYDRIYKKGDKIAQLVAEETNPIQFKLVSELDDTKRGSGGFGSTDNKPVDPTKTSNQSFKEMVGKLPGASLSELYQKSGGVPIKKKYIDEVKGRKE